MVYSRIHRLLRILTLIQAQTGWGPARLAAECGVNERTIYRDIDELRAAGIPCDYDAKSEGYRVAAEFFLPPVQLTAEEALSLAVLCEQVADPSQIAHLASAVRALEKIQAAMP
ncbi:MAG: HTH domain-containing protein, partial [Planctomycetota bacterium]|nr:HTH domain-containing protein [Planctomycetota bacterium]